MRNLIRKIHLYTGLIVVLFVLMYFVSGYTMVRGADFWGPRTAMVTQRTDPLNFTGPRTPQTLTDYVGEHYGEHGRLTIPNQPAGGAVKFTLRRPGTSIDVEVPAAGDSINLKTTKGGFRGVLNDMHRIHGYASGSWLLNAIALFNDLASASMILFALSGAYLWWSMTKKHFWGFVCLGASCAYAIAIVVYLAMSK
jgi:hypothetical protein